MLICEMKLKIKYNRLQLQFKGAMLQQCLAQPNQPPQLDSASSVAK